MIKNWEKFNESFKKGKKIEAKIDILKEISNDLSDMGLEIEIWSGSWKDDSIGRFKASQFIIMRIEDNNNILDDNNYYENELSDKKEILEFEHDLVSHGMNYKIKRGFSDKVYFYFDKGKSTDTDILMNYKD